MRSVGVQTYARVKPAATAKPSTVTRPASAALRAGLRDHRVDQHHQQRARGEAVDPGAASVPEAVSAMRVAGDGREGADGRDGEPEADDLGPRGACMSAGGADRLRQVGHEDRGQQADAHALAGGEADARAPPAPGCRPGTRRARARIRRRRPLGQRAVGEEVGERDRRRARAPAAPPPPILTPSSARSKLTALISAPAPKASTRPTRRSGQRRARPSERAEHERRRGERAPAQRGGQRTP